MPKKWLNEEAIDVLCDYYYPRAKWLQDNVNWGQLDYEGPEANEIIDDPLMQKIDIYDCYTRNAAGFQNVLQDLKFGSETPKSRWHDSRRKDINKWNNEITWGLSTWFFVFMCHRITGSGASFENDHGYRNNCIQYWGTQYAKNGIKEMCEDLIKAKERGPIFTSIGNQPPAPKKGTTNVDFMTKELPPLIYRFTVTSLRRNSLSGLNIRYNYNQGFGAFLFNKTNSHLTSEIALSYDISDYLNDSRKTSYLKLGFFWDVNFLNTFTNFDFEYFSQISEALPKEVLSNRYEISSKINYQINDVIIFTFGIEYEKYIFKKFIINDRDVYNSIYLAIGFKEILGWKL